MTAVNTLLQLILVFAAVTNAASFCPVPQYCVTSNIVQNDTVMELAISSTATGWVAFGIGTGMQGADIMIAWIDASTQVGYVSDYTGVGYTRPAYDAKQDWTLVKSAISSTNRTIIARRPLVTTDNTFDQPFRSGVRSYIYAYSDAAVSGPPSANKAIERHSVRGVFKINLFDSAALGTGSSSPVAYSNTFLTHGILMFFAWGVFSYAGIFVARFLKVSLGVWWFRLHTGLLLGGTGALTIIAFILAVMQLELHFYALHHILGLFVTVVMVLQMILGKVIDSLWRPNRGKIPIWDKIHWWTGRLLAMLSVVTIITGLLTFNAPIYVVALFCIWVVIVLGAFAYGQNRYGQVHHPKESSSMGLDSDVTIRQI